WARRNPAVAGLSVLVLAVLVTGLVVSTLFGLEANRREVAERQEKIRAEEQEGRATKLAAEKGRTIDALRDYLAVADQRLAEQPIDQGAAVYGLSLLNRLRPGEGEADPRGFFWRYLRHRCRHAHGTALEAPDLIRAIAVSPDGKSLAYVGVNHGGSGTVR